MITREYDAAVVFGIEPKKGPDGKWHIPDEFRTGLDVAGKLLVANRVGKVIISGRRAVRQRWLSPRDWHPQDECDMGKDYLVIELGCDPDSILTGNTSEDTPSNLAETTRLAIAESLGNLAGITSPARVAHVNYLADLTIREHRAFDIIPTDYQSTPAEIASRAQTLAVHQFGFRDIEPGDLDTLEARFFDGEPYQFFRYLDRSRDHAERNMTATWDTFRSEDPPIITGPAGWNRFLMKHYYH